MGRVSREQAGHNRERVVEAACRLFRMHGVANASIADVMKEAGLTVGGFYKQFESKEALVGEAFALAFRQAGGVWADIARQSRGAGEAEALDALLRHYFKPRPIAHNCPMLAFASTAGNTRAENSPGKANDGGIPAEVYGRGVQALFEQFREYTAPPAGQGSAKDEAEAMVRFAAMLGAGLLSWAMGPTPWVGKVQSAVLDEFGV